VWTSANKQRFSLGWLLDVFFFVFFVQMVRMWWIEPSRSVGKTSPG
jgi:uncharacterized protein YggT (Ycf19 family)